MKSKNLKNSLIGLVVIVVLTVVLIMCADPLYAAISNAGRVQGTESIYEPGTYVVEEEGFGGIVTVTVTVDDKNILDIAIDAPDETPEIGGAATGTLASEILKNQTADIDGVSGASFTSGAVKSAVAEALSMAQAGAGSKPAVDVSYTPGTYEADEVGIAPMTVRVTFDDSSIVDIEIDNEETEGIGSVAVEEIPAAIIKGQTLAVDGVSGATLSSTAILAGVEDCITQAGVDADLLK